MPRRLGEDADIVPCNRANSPTAIIAAALALFAAPAALAACQLDEVAELPVTMLGLRPLAHARINGKDAVFVIDTGAFNSVLSPAAAARYGLRTQFERNLRVEGVGGSVPADSTLVRRVELGGATLRNMRFVVVDGAGPDVAGVLGQDVLPGADVEYDFARTQMRFLKPKGCGPQDLLAYWVDGKVSSLPMIRAGAQVNAWARLNDQAIRVQFDTGSAHSGMTLPAAARAGVTPASPGVIQTPGSVGIGGKSAQTWIAPFGRLVLGAEEIRNTRLRISRTNLGEADMVLGADFFLAHRVYVSRLQGKIYFTYNGGPVFRLAEDADGAKP
jgi:predicted aspartyl protease